MEFVALTYCLGTTGEDFDPDDTATFHNFAVGQRYAVLRWSISFILNINAKGDDHTA
jgi:hypothetical protein